jgi:hypothetical protein
MSTLSATTLHSPGEEVQAPPKIVPDPLTSPNEDTVAIEDKVEDKATGGLGEGAAPSSAVNERVIGDVELQGGVVRKEPGSKGWWNVVGVSPVQRLELH